MVILAVRATRAKWLQILRRCFYLQVWGGGNMLKSKRVTQKVVGSNPRAGKDFNKL